MCETMQCDGRCAKPKVHYTMGHQAQAARFEALEERLQRIELLLERSLAREKNGLPESVGSFPSTAPRDG